eukprot:scaffold13358_cov123-Skeletonema_dohrnii-CCMP3373.AAC.1
MKDLIFDFKTDSLRFDHETGILSHIFNKGARAPMTETRNKNMVSRRICNAQPALIMQLRKG